MILVDTNVWVDLIADDVEWQPWSLQQIRLASLRDRLAINAVIYAELSAKYREQSELDNFLAPTRTEVVPISNEAAFLAGKAFASYRERKGVKTGVLPDFFIGAQAQAEGWTLLTRDPGRYKTYFSGVKLICP